MESEMDDLACQWIADVCAPTEVAGIDDLRDGTPRLALLLALAGLDSHGSAKQQTWLFYLPYSRQLSSFESTAFCRRCDPVRAVQRAGAGDHQADQPLQDAVPAAREHQGGHRRHAQDGVREAPTACLRI